MIFDHLNPQVVWAVDAQSQKSMRAMTGTDNSPILGAFLAFYQHKWKTS
jgi:hypothetical protein